MEALEFLKERKRMCRSFGESCEGCPLEGTKCVVSSIVPDEDYKRIIATVEQWAEEHPRKTRQSEFLARWPAARLDERGVLSILPCLMNPIQYRTPEDTCATGMMCMDCRKKYWMQEVE